MAGFGFRSLSVTLVGVLASAGIVLGAPASASAVQDPPDCMADANGGCTQGPLGGGGSGASPFPAGTPTASTKLDKVWEGSTLFAQHRGSRVWAFRNPQRVGETNTWLVEVNRGVYDSVGAAAADINSSGALDRGSSCSNAGTRQDVLECR